MGRKLKKEWEYVYIELIHFTVQQELTRHCKATTIKNIKIRDKKALL